MADSRRRTLAASGQQTGIPVPTSIARPSQQLRQSLAPGMGMGHSMGLSARQSLAPQRSISGHRQSTIGFPSSSQTSDGFGPAGSQGSQMFSQGHGGPAREVPSTVARNNMYSSNHGSMSVSRSGTLKSGQMLEYAPPSERRTSTYRRQTLNNGMATTPGRLQVTQSEKPKQDPRPLKQNLSRYTHEIAQFLAARQCPIELKPTGPAFQTVFKFLVNLSDPAVRFQPGTTTGKAWEEEFFTSLSVVGYPFERSISKSHLQAVGSTSTWANFVGLLHWLITLIDQRDAAFDHDLELHIPASLDDDIERSADDIVQHAWLAFAGAAYPKFLATDDYNEHTSQAEQEVFWSKIEAGRREQRERVTRMEEEQRQLEEELAALKATPDALEGWEKRLATTNRDLDKLDKYNRAIEAAKETHRKQMADIANTKSNLLKEQEIIKTEIERKQGLIDAQGMTAHEVQALRTDREKLTADIAQTGSKYRAQMEKSHDLEMKLTKVMNKAIQTCGVYEGVATRVGVLPAPPEGYEDVNFVQEINGAADDPAPDCLTRLRPALQELRQKEKQAYNALLAEDAELENRVVRLDEECQEEKEQEGAVVAELNLVDQDIQNRKEEVNDEFTKSSIQIDQLQQVVNQLSSTLNHPLQQAEWRLEQRTLERTSVVDDITRRRTQNRDALTAALEKLLTFKDHCMSQTELMARIASGEE